MSGPPTLNHLSTIERVAKSLIASSSFRSLVELLGDLSGASRCLLLRKDKSGELIIEGEFASPEIGPLAVRKFPSPDSWDAPRISRLFSEPVQHVFAIGNEPRGALTFHGQANSEVVALAERLIDDIASVLRDTSGEDLNKLLLLERSLRALIWKLHSSLDRNWVMQTGVDSLGHLLKADLCLFVQTERKQDPLTGTSTTVSTVTHEFIRSNLSPLGLGKTSTVPDEVVTRFLTQTSVALAPAIEPADLLDEDRSWLGTPVVLNKETFGVLIAQDIPTRQWSKQDTEIIELIAASLTHALTNAMAHEHVKEQIFHLKLASQLTGQLTQALDQVGRLGPPKQEARQPQAVLPLSNRELEVLRLIAGGLANREIAQRLFLTESTVELHASRIRKKLKLKSRTALVKFACDNGVV